jgi:hypothetical protein
MFFPYIDQDLSIESPSLSRYWCQSEDQLYLTRSLTCLAVAGLFRVKHLIESVQNPPKDYGKKFSRVWLKTLNCIRGVFEWDVIKG